MICVIMDPVLNDSILTVVILGEVICCRSCITVLAFSFCNFVHNSIMHCS